MYCMLTLGTSCSLQSGPESHSVWVSVSMTCVSAESCPRFLKQQDIHILGSGDFHLRHKNEYAKFGLEYLDRRY